jgi:hypothetical protein
MWGIEMGRACGTYGERRVAYGFLEGKHEGKDNLEGQRLCGRIILTH